MRARITSTPERAKASANLAELIFRSADFGTTSAEEFLATRPEI